MNRSPRCTPEETAELNGVEPYARLCDVLARMVDGHPAGRLDEPLPFKPVTAGT